MVILISGQFTFIMVDITLIAGKKRKDFSIRRLFFIFSSILPLLPSPSSLSVYDPASSLRKLKHSEENFHRLLPSLHLPSCHHLYYYTFLSVVTLATLLYKVSSFVWTLHSFLFSHLGSLLQVHHSFPLQH